MYFEDEPIDEYYREHYCTQEAQQSEYYADLEADYYGEMERDFIEELLLEERLGVGL